MVYQKREASKEFFFVNQDKIEDKLEINLINIQGLTQQKQTELEKNMSATSVMCITETQHKLSKSQHCRKYRTYTLT